MIHSDVWGPFRVDNITGARWFVSFIDDHTRLTWIFLMREKSEVCQIFKSFNKMIQNQFQTKIQILRTDNGKEYFNSLLGNYLINEGIIHQSSCVETPQQNGVSERKNRHLLEVARSIMFSSNVPKQFWGEAVLTAAYLINRLPSRVLKFQTPCQLLLKTYPDTRILSQIPSRVFGCSVFVHTSQVNRSKLDPRSIKCIFVGYAPTQKGYRCYSPSTKRFYTSMDVTFMENQPFYPKSTIQGGNVSQEFQLWETLNTDQNIQLWETMHPNQTQTPPSQSHPLPHNSSQIQTQTHPSSTENQESHSHMSPTLSHLPLNQTGNSKSHPPTETHIYPSKQINSLQPDADKEFIVYTRKEKNQKEIEHQKSLQCHDSEPNQQVQIPDTNTEVAVESILGKSDSDSTYTNNEMFDIDQPIAI